MLACFEVIRPRTVRKVTLFPDPDSPTTPSVSPAARLNETPSTALTKPSSVGKCTFRSRTWSRDSVTRPPRERFRSRVPDPRVKVRVHDIDHQVRHDDEQRREDRDPHRRREVVRV